MKKNPVIHFEMPYQDYNRLEKFYTEAFDWDLMKLDEKMGNYVLATTTDTDKDRMVTRPGTINGGFFPKRAEGAQHPSVVIEVEDIHEAIKKVTDAGGKVLGEPVDISGIGKYVSFIDPEGNQASMMQTKK